METFWEIMAGVGFIIGDVAAVLAAVGTLAMLIVALINFASKRRVIYVPDLFLHWAGAGLFFSAMAAIGLNIAPGYDLNRIGLFFRFNYMTLVSLVAASLVMLVCVIMLRRAHPLPPVRRRTRA